MSKTATRKAGLKKRVAAKKTARSAKKPARKVAKKMVRKAVKKTASNPHTGSGFDDFLRAEGAYEEAQSVAIKRVLAWQLTEKMREQNLSKTQMAKRLQTSRSQLDRLLDPAHTDVKLDTLVRAARAVDCELRIELAAAA